MADIMSFSPLWNEWHIKELIGKGTFGAVYKAEKNEYGNQYYSAIKHLSIPPANVTKESLIADGIASDEKSLVMYCNTLRDQIINEINVCYRLRGNTNIVAYEDHCIIPKKDGIGYDIFIRMELLTGLTSYMVKNPMNENDVIRLGIELCDALSVLDMNHMIHRDIKPANIFVNSNGVFKLGDFGESKVLSNSNMGMTIRGTYSYISPEISKGQAANITADIYSLGLVMYRLLNGNKAPFILPSDQPVNSAMSENANIRRLKGEPVPPPAYCSNPALTAVVLRACAFNKEDRWQTPKQMKQALEALLKGQDTQYSAHPKYQQAYAQPVSSSELNQNQMPMPERQAPPPIQQSMQPSLQAPAPILQAPPPLQPMQQQLPQPVSQPKSKKKIGLIIGLSAGAVAIIVAVVLIIVLVSNGGVSNSLEGTYTAVYDYSKLTSEEVIYAQGTEIKIILQSGGTAYYVNTFKPSITGYEQDVVQVAQLSWSRNGDTLTLSNGSNTENFIISNGRLTLQSENTIGYFSKTSDSTTVPKATNTNPSIY